MRESYVFYMDQLRGSYLDTFTAIRQYCLITSEHESDLEERLSALLDEFLQAQAQNVPVERIVGNDLHRFCENLWMDLDWKNRLWATADRIKPVICWMAPFYASATVLRMVDPDAAETLRLGGWTGYVFLFGTAMVLWYLADALFRGVLRRSKKMPAEWKQGLCFIASSACSFGTMLLLWKLCPDMPIPVVSGLLLCVAFLTCYSGLNKIRKPETCAAELPEAQDDPVEKMIREDTPPIHAQMKERIGRINRRRARRGKMPWTQTEFTDSLRTEMKQKERWMDVTAGLMLLTGVAVIWIGHCINPAETLVTAVCTILAVGMVLPYSYRVTRAENQRVREWMEELEHHPEWWNDLNK